MLIETAVLPDIMCLDTRFTRIALVNSRKNDTHRTGYQPVIVYYTMNSVKRAFWLV